MNRQEANRAILALLSSLVEINPSWRFHQLLQNAGVVQSRPAGDRIEIVDQYHEESTSTLIDLRRYVDGKGE